MTATMTLAEGGATQVTGIGVVVGGSVGSSVRICCVGGDVGSETRVGVGVNVGPGPLRAVGESGAVGVDVGKSRTGVGVDGRAVAEPEQAVARKAIDSTTKMGMPPWNNLFTGTFMVQVFYT